MSKQDLLDYSPIGGHNGGDILKNLSAVEVAHTSNEQTRNKKTYALLGIAFDLAAQLANDAMAWERFCELDRWQGRKSRPKLDDEVSEIYRFVALRCFSSESGANDDRANKYGRVIDYCRRKGTPAFKIAKFIEDRGFEETYSAAVKEFPIRTKSNVSAEAIADESDKQNAEENDEDNDDNQTKEDSTSLRTENNLAGGTGYDDRNATYGKSNRDRAVDDDVVGFRCSRQTQFNRLMKLGKKQRKYVLIECEGHTDGWVNLRIVKFAKPKRVI